MSKILSLSCLFVMLAAMAMSGPVRADDGDIDMKTVTCKQANESGSEFSTILIFWIDGYLSKEKNDSIMSKKWLDDLGSIVKEGCAATPDEPLLNIVRNGMK